jgi:N-acyl-D-amino-acid deacylase
MKTTLIRHGTIVDGTGAPAYAGDILVSDDRIAGVFPAGAPLPAADAHVDASGKLVTPGFIDAHAHSDAYLILEPDAPSKIAQGITTEINGQCGGSIAPRYGEARLSSDWASLLGERLTWRSLGEYRAVFEAASPAVNTVQFIGHNTLRSSVVGYAPRAASAEECRRMATLLEEALDAGAWGLTTGLIYQPGKYAVSGEVLALARVAAARGGFYATHMRSEGDAVLEAIDEVLTLARETGVRAQISHLKTSGRANWGRIDAVLDKMDAAVDAGVLLGSDRYPFCASATDLDVVLPDWAQAGAAPAECARLADAATRARLAAELDASTRDWSSVMIGGTWHPETKACSGRRVDDLAAAYGTTPGEIICRILEKDRCRTGAFFFVMCEENLDRILSRPWVLPGSDASLRAPWGPLGADHPHPRAYATMPRFYRRLRALGFSREETIARMTSAVARRFGIGRRGVIETGASADLVVWDEASFGAEATYAAPHRFATGVSCVMVNGVVSYADGRFTGRRGGRFLERP